MTSFPFAQFHAAAAANYNNGCRTPAGILPEADLADLRRAGISSQILFDYAEDFIRYGAPSAADFAAVAEIRRDVFLRQLDGCWPGSVVPESALPLREAELDGVAWLPRILAKARCFLAGSLCPEVMYGCSGDRRFLAAHNLTLTGFLACVRDAADDPAAVLAAVKTQTSFPAPPMN